MINDDSVRSSVEGFHAVRTILVVDDEDDIRMLIREILEEQGYTVLDAVDGKEALRVICRAPIDLIILDLVMPEQEGIETLPLLRRRWPRTKVLAISGAFGASFLRCAQSLGADGTLKKPFSCDTLINLVEGLLQGVPG